MCDRAPSFEAYVDDRTGSLIFSTSGKTAQLFDASAPDAPLGDAETTEMPRATTRRATSQATSSK
ncbi:MAG TPA: hypothetical protein VEK56_14655 [Vicinamibacterales bacterium]|nr:hypothetical protein [Vicinamibacterales bacterium]